MWKRGLIILMLGVAACQSSPASTPVAPTALPSPTPMALAARVNGAPIPLAEFERRLAAYEQEWRRNGLDPQSAEGRQRLAALPRQILEGMIEEVLIEQHAARMGITVSPEEVEAALAQLIQESGGVEAFRQRLAALGMTEEEFRRNQRAAMLAQKVFQQLTADLPEVAEQVHARHIQVSQEDLARQLLARLQQGEDFIELARRYSEDVATRELGGDLGWFARGTLAVPELEEAAFATPPGQVTWVTTPRGYHLLWVVEKDPARPLSEDQRELLRQRRIQAQLQAWRAEAQVEILIPLGP
ncbi:MAG: SurA N-terminal domain-containing protein [Thermoflexus sp.]|jgi:parvulin-like peptidyl-prolyl isomerase|nr:SurA N-terminal domain-containing protein [Thermoflexus sp.]MDT7883355.1 SurA N-terminal domain-containing protein [Thermoflexus sp.]MDT7946863.1 SurA N-terminal domain-containing protein [Thermoflexus sp.]